ncbi:MAG: protein kinase domain-containing protein [Woeseiaceae bacterium]|jgi:tetratricopeptide (TPR) repeat protein
MQDLQKGTELAKRYTLVRKLGSGGGSQTWLASDRMTRADVAIKILVDERRTPADLRHEWQTSIRLMHAHIVRVFEFNDDPECPFYTLQLIEGPDIGAMSGAPLEHLLPPLAFVADALRYAHGKGVVHRDIKASNILLDHNGAPYLIDFGVAADENAVAGGGSLIAASPQSLAGEPPQPADDIFALGGLIYELVAGRSPYSGGQTERDIREKSPEPLAAADGTPVPVAVQQLVAAMLDKDAGRRPDAAAVVAALEAAGFAAAPAPKHYVAGARSAAAEIIEVSEAARSRPQSMAARTPDAVSGEPSGLSPRVVGISLLVLLAVLVGVVFILPATVTTESPRPVAEKDQNDAQSSDDERPRSGVGFTENVNDLEGRDERVVARAETETVLGELLSKMDTLDKRAVQRWGGLRYKQAQSAYAEGDEAYLARNYAVAIDRYRLAIDIVEPLLDEVDQVFATTFAEGQAALEAADAAEALRLFELAVAISPSNSAAQAGYTRAKNLDAVLALTDQGLAYEKDLELEASRQSFSQAIELDPQWEPAQAGLERVLATIQQMDFDQRMTEGLTALAEGDYPGARAAFRMAQELKPGSQEPADGLLQVDQGIRLDRISALERQAQSQEQAEAWETAAETYEALLEIDPNLLFAQQGLSRAQQMAALHEQLDRYLAEPDRLSSPATMRAATTLVVDITRMPAIGPRLGNQRDELSRLLKRAATPLSVQLVSDNLTDVSIYKVGKLGSFTTHELKLRPGTYVAVGSRPGYRDVRLEFRVGPEIEPRPIVVRCEEAI